MTWNHRDKLFAMGVVIQPTPGVFVLPGQADLVGVANPDAGTDMQSTQDPTQTGSVWDANRIYLGQTGTGGGTIPLRGPGGAAPPAANTFPLGRIMQACGFAEIIKAAGGAPTAHPAGSTTTSLALANTESAVDDIFIGVPIASGSVGVGVRSTTMIRDYVGATRTALLAETLGTAPAAGSNYQFPASMTYLLGTLTTPPPLLSISVWRDRRRYDFRDCVISSWSIDVPVANEANQGFPSIQFAFKGVPLDDDGTVKTTPTLPTSLLNIPVPPAKGGKFFLDKVKLGHASTKFSITLETGAASNQNQDAGQDGYDILSGSRTIEFDLNQMDVADFDVGSRVKNQTLLSLLDTWGGGAGNCMGLMVQNLVLDPLKPGSRNGYVSLTGNGAPTDVDKAVALSFWGWTN
jgi:hypothetical protein